MFAQDTALDVERKKGSELLVVGIVLSMLAIIYVPAYIRAKRRGVLGEGDDFMARRRKIKGTFCEEKIALKTEFDRRSFRYKKSGKAWVITGCPKGQWDPKGYVTVKGKRKRGRCKVGTRGHKLLAPQVGATCPVGTKRVRK